MTAIRPPMTACTVLGYNSGFYGRTVVLLLGLGSWWPRKTLKDDWKISNMLKKRKKTVKNDSTMVKKKMI